MPKVSRAFFAMGATYLLLGICWGMYMGMSKDHASAPAHAHFNLLGWVTFSLYGTYYALAQKTVSMRLAWIVFWVSQIGFVISIPVLGYIMLGGERSAYLVQSIRFGERAMGAALVIFIYQVWKEFFRKEQTA